MSAGFSPAPTARRPPREAGAWGARLVVPLFSGADIEAFQLRLNSVTRLRVLPTALRLSRLLCTSQRASFSSRSRVRFTQKSGTSVHSRWLSIRGAAEDKLNSARAGRTGQDLAHLAQFIARGAG